MSKPRPLALALCLLGAALGHAAPAYPDLAAAVSAPAPEPAPPGDTFNPPISPGLAPDSCAPAIAEWTRSAGPGNSLVLTGSRLSNYTGASLGQDTAFWVYGGNSGGNATMTAGAIQRLGQAGDRAMLTLAASLPDSCYLLWPENAGGLGAPVLVNQTDFWWLGPSDASAGQTISAFGRNLYYNNLTPTVYVGPAGGPFNPITPSGWNPYKVDFQVPALANGSYQVWVHNGHGGHWGWSGPQTLTVVNPLAWTGPTVNLVVLPTAGGADPSGSGDSYQALSTALAVASTLASVSGNATVQLPAGNFAVSRHLIPPSHVRLLGAGMGSTTITARNGFQDTCLLGPNNPHSSDNIEIDNLGFAAGPSQGNNLPQSGPNNNILLWLRSITNVHFNNVFFEAVGSCTLDFSNDTFMYFNNCKFQGGNNQTTTLYSLVPSQVFINGCAFYGTYDAGGLIGLSAVQGLSVTNCTGQDWYNSTTTSGRGWDQGRFLYGNTAVNSERNIYAGDNATYQLAVRPGTIGSTGQLDVNAGEQFLWEGNFTFASGHPSGVGPDTLSLPGLGSAAAGKNVANFWEAVVVAGQGLGQHRLVTAYNGGSTITVSPPWQVPPDGGSLVILCQDLDKCVLYQNQIQGKSDYGTFASSSLGIEPYGGSFDFIADGNNIQQVRRGINSFSRAETNHDLGSIEPVYFNLYQNNLISSVLVGASGIISDWSPGLTDYPGILYLGNLFRGNGINGAAQAGIQLSLGNITAIPGMQMDMNVFEANAVSNTPLAVSCIGSATAQPLGPQLGNTLFYANQFNGCTCSSAPAGSQGIVFGAGQSPALQRNSWADFQATYAGSAPGAVSEAPFRAQRLAAFPDSGSTVVWNSGSAPQTCTLTPLAGWLSFTPASGLVPSEGSFTFTYNAAALTSTGIVAGSSRSSLGASSLGLQFYFNPVTASAGIGHCLAATPTPIFSGGSPTTYLFPSPARGASAKVAYTLSGAGTVKILVFNEAGRLVDKVEDQKPAGFQTSTLSTGDWAPGVYFYLCTLSPANGAAQTLPVVKFAVIH